MGGAEWVRVRVQSLEGERCDPSGKVKGGSEVGTRQRYPYKGVSIGGSVGGKR
jgi:hypothetical protein